MRENPVKSLIRRVFFEDGTERRIAFGPLKGFRYRVSPITGIAAWYSGPEREMQQAFKRLVRPGYRVMDVGANWGGHSLLLSRLVGKSGQVIAMEPSPAVAEESRWHLTANALTNVSLLEVALAEAEAIGTFEGAKMSTTGHLSHKTQAAPGQVIVQITTLDKIVSDQAMERVDLIKIDVEGAESRVLKGAVDTLKRHRPMLIVELHTPEQDLAVSSILRSFGYILRRLDGTLITRPDLGWPHLEGVWGTILATAT